MDSKNLPPCSWKPEAAFSPEPVQAT